MARAAKAPPARKAARKRTKRRAAPAKGRPTEYRPEYASQAEKLCLLGYTDGELAAFFGVDERTINNWKKRYPEFFQSLRDGRDLADAQVARGMFQRATGYERKTVKTVVDPANPDKALVQTTVEEVGPDLGAGKLWMHNRQARFGRFQVDPDRAVGAAAGAGMGAGLAAIFASIDGGTRGIAPADGEELDDDA